MSDDVFVDAAAPLVFSDDSILAFFKATPPETWFYASRAGRIAMDGDKYRLVLVRNRKKGGGGLETKGGMLATQIDLAPVIGSVDEERAWTEAIKRNSPFVPPDVERVTLRPLGLRNGRMTIGGLEGLVENPVAYRDVPIGVQTSLPITLPLTADGADTAWGILGTPAGFPVTVRFDYDYDVLYPGAHYKITAETHKVYDYFSANAKARASYFGLVGAQADLDLIRSELTSSGAVVIEWLVRPEGFDDSRVAQLQSSILDAFAKSALDLMVADVVPDREAPAPEGYFGGVSVRLKDFHEVEKMNLSGEFKQNDMRTQTFSFSFSFAQLRNLDRSQYGVDITGDNVIPVTLNLGKDPAHVQKYLMQYGYRKLDGSFNGASAEGTGANGLLLQGVVQWDAHEPQPPKTEIQFGVDYEQLDWEDFSTLTEKANGPSGVMHVFTPGTYIRKIAVLSDLLKAEPGELASFEWRTVFAPNPPGTRPNLPKDYGGGVLYDGAGIQASPDKFAIEFPYNNEVADGSKFEWEAVLIKNDGTVLHYKETKPLKDVSTVLASRTRLKPMLQVPPATTVVRARGTFALRRTPTWPAASNEA
ncbi:hypothetical protein [Streptomyces sp. NBC_00996]|uniref:hypothetical protein n=1 Tax=Streptomyces sp. NBC_00996 TaxID=2903710 RepID=UPI003869646B|nr:hypothetical protein OG390_49250 [Streptomyces sp. NBC_00996]